MTESYSCNGKWVHFSNGACQELQLTWAGIAENINSEPAMKLLAQSLKERSKYATGVAAIGIDDEYLDEPYSNREVKIAWQKVMSYLISDISNSGDISKSMDINWDDDLRKSWLERLSKMNDCLSKQIET